MAELKNFIDQGNTSIYDGHERSELFELAKQIDQAMHEKEEKELEEQSAKNFTKAEKERAKGQTAKLNETSDDITTNGKPEKSSSTIIQTHSSGSNKRKYSNDYDFFELIGNLAAPVVEKVEVKIKPADVEKDMLRYCSSVDYTIEDLLIPLNDELGTNNDYNMLKSLNLNSIISLYCLYSENSEFDKFSGNLERMRVSMFAAIKVWSQLNSLKDSINEKGNIIF